MSSFTTPLDIRCHSVPMKEKPFELLADFEFYYHDKLITAKKGYRTDFGTIPRWLWSLFPPYGPHGKACVTHDIVCDIKGHFGYTAREAAEMFLEGMTILNVIKWRRKAMFRGVRLGGPRWKL